uniref:VapC9 PIN-like domain-containing protein n=1 Tax=Ignisphaera aggregans TaxID=334771 RepID=A0A7J3I903_9CREN
MEISRVGSSKRLEEFNCIAIVDTSVILLISAREAHLDDMIDLIPGCAAVVLTPVIGELQLIARKRNSEKSHIAKWALENLLRLLNVVEVPVMEQRKVDDLIVEFAEEMKKAKRVLIVTADTKLKNDAVRRGINVLWYRKEKKGFEMLIDII